MPTYEYICRACGHEFEEFQSIKAEPTAVCPKCRKKKVDRKISGGGAVIFKGRGFYETDYRSESYKSGADAEKKAGESKPDATPASEAKSSSGLPQRQYFCATHLQIQITSKHLKKMPVIKIA